MLPFYLSLIDNDEDKNKFHQLYYTHKNAMLYTATEILSDPFLAEDAVQDALLVLARKISDIRTDNPTETKAFIVTVTKNCARKIVNKNSKYTFLSEDEPSLEETIPDPVDYESRMVSLSVYNELKQILNTLDFKYISVLQLQEMGYTIKEIAGFMNLSESAVKMRLSRVKKMIYAKLEDKL